jgi:hypothetical protein
VHALPVSASVWVDLAVDEQDVQNHALSGAFMIDGLVRKSLDILLDLGPDYFVLTYCIPRRLVSVSRYADIRQQNWNND